MSETDFEAESLTAIEDRLPIEGETYELFETASGWYGLQNVDDHMTVYFVDVERRSNGYFLLDEDDEEVGRVSALDGSAAILPQGILSFLEDLATPDPQSPEDHLLELVEDALDAHANDYVNTNVRIWNPGVRPTVFVGNVRNNKLDSPLTRELAERGLLVESVSGDSLWVTYANEYGFTQEEGA